MLRYADHALERIPREERFCRFCKAVVESPEHALIECQSSPAIQNLVSGKTVPHCSETAD
jgi:hypothetical protein